MTKILLGYFCFGCILLFILSVSGNSVPDKWKQLQQERMEQIENLLSSPPSNQ